MSDIVSITLEKLTSYNLFNYLFPGSVFLVGCDRIAHTKTVEWPIVVFVLIAYFAGLVLSRIGSLVIEPVLKRVRFVKYAAYADFLKAEKADQKVATLLESNNTYRTLLALFFALLVVQAGVSLRTKHPEFGAYAEWVWPMGFLFIFAWSYRKQTAYIATRVDVHCQPSQPFPPQTPNREEENASTANERK